MENLIGKALKIKCPSVKSIAVGVLKQTGEIFIFSIFIFKYSAVKSLE